MSDAARIVLLGATGLVGSRVAQRGGARNLAILVRRPVDDHPSVTSRIEVAASECWPQILSQMAPDIVICCIGTTMRKAGGNADLFRNSDQHLPIACARAVRMAGARHMIIVTSVGASSRTGNVYLNAKGRVEDALRALDFNRLDIIRPGLLIGARNETRPMEALGQRLAPWIDPVLQAGLRKYRSIDADSVARAIWTLADGGGSGVHIHEHDAIVQLAD